MKLILHILLKDLRRHLWEILLFLFVLFAWAMQEAFHNKWIANSASGLLPSILTLLWAFVIVRVIQGESAIGTTEFWLTRPYRWPHLLTEKLLCLFFVIHLPIAIAQISLLTHSGFALQPDTLAHLFLFLIGDFFLITLPIAVLASITQSLVRWVIWVVLILLFALFMAWLPWGSSVLTFAGNLAIRDHLLVSLILFAPIILVLQARRAPLWIARTLFIVVVLLVPIIVFLGYSSNTFFRIAYPHSETAAFTAKSQATQQASVSHLKTFGTSHLRSIYFQIELNQLPPNELYKIEARRFHISAPNHHDWTTEWESDNYEIRDSKDRHTISFQIPDSEYQSLKQQPIHVQAEFAVQKFTLQPESIINTGADQFNLPDGTHCHWTKLLTSHEVDYNYTQIECSSNLPAPDITVATIKSEEIHCPGRLDSVIDSDSMNKPIPPLKPGLVSSNYQYAQTFMQDGPTINPVHRVSLNLESIHFDDNHYAYGCRGELLHFQTGSALGRSRFVTDLGNLTLKEISEEEQKLELEQSNPVAFTKDEE